MTLQPYETLLIILAVALGTMLTRFLPFLLFPEHKKRPRLILYLGNVLPAAMIGLLVVYCLRNVSVTSGNHALPEALAAAAVCFLHRWKENTLLSIAGGTAVYMIIFNFF